MKETRLTSKTVFEGRVIQVRVDSVRLANGREAVREVADHAPAVVIAPIDADGSVVLVRQYRYPVEEALLEAPAGIVEPGEEPDDCAQRELQEETGYRADDMRPLGGLLDEPRLLLRVHVRLRRAGPGPQQTRGGLRRGHRGRTGPAFRGARDDP